MNFSIAIMYGVAALFTALGVALLLALVRQQSEARVYAYRMVGIMALSLGIVLAMSATAMWRWSVAYLIGTWHAQPLRLVLLARGRRVAVCLAST